jgi:hypothetical protein
LLLCAAAIAQTAVAGFTPGSFRVTESGAAEYRIPLRVPPGVAGMEPKLALVYNSQAGNGLLGVGWNLEGLSAITRCPRTMAQDGVRGGVNYDWNDRYCLDGQRLIALSGTEHRTERESFSKIVSYGTAGNGPAWFKVWTKSGLVLEYGKTDDSRIEAQGKPTVRVWALNKVSDARGNSLAVTYAEDSEESANGDYRPVRIDYSANPAATVEFSYEARTDAAPAYLAGSRVRQTSRLTSVKTRVGPALVADYRLAYQYAPSTGRSRLASVVQCDGGGSCRPATSFTWQDGAPGFAPRSVWGSGAGATRQLGDFNGDGKTDLIQLAANGTAYVWLSTGSGFAPYTAWGTGVRPTDQLGDFNGDGKTDLIQLHENGNAYVWLSTGSAFAPYTVWGTGVRPADKLGDFNGDGRTDVIQLYESGSAVVWLSTGSGFAPYAYWGTGVTPNDQVGDFNGDGKSDIVQLYSSGSAVVWLSNGSGFENYQYWGSGVRPIDKLGDFNGDGKTDVIQLHENGNAYVWLSTGSGFTPYAVWGTGVRPTDKLGDFNGDGKTDVIQLYDSGSAVVWLSTGSGFTPYAYWAADVTPDDMLGDIDGDGKTDLVQINGPNNEVYVFLSSGPFPDLLSTISRGPNQLASIEYKPLTSASVYTKGSGATYPQADVQPPLYVVATTSVSNGIGGTAGTAYKYAGRRISADGRGSLGFSQMSAVDAQTQVKTSLVFRQDWPYVGMPSLIQEAQGSGAALRQTANTHSCMSSATVGVCFPFVSASVESGWELNGAARPVVTTTTQYDSFGNPTSVSVSTADGHGTTTITTITNNTYSNDTANWQVGRLLRSTVQSTIP